MTEEDRSLKRRSQKLVGPVGVAWYTRRAWEKLKEAVSDPDQLEDSFEEWLEMAEFAEKKLAGVGMVTERVLVDAHQFLSWCQKADLTPDSGARSRFVTETLQERYAGKRPQSPSGTLR